MLTITAAAAACGSPASRPAAPPASASAGAAGAGSGDEPEVAALAPVIDSDPAQLMGLGPRGLTDFLGPPELVRREDPAEIWQYRNQACVLDVFLYPESGNRQVTYVEARDSAAAPAEPRACLGALLRQKVPTS